MANFNHQLQNGQGGRNNPNRLPALPHQTKSPAAQCNKAFVVVVSVFIGPFRAGIGTVPFQVGCRTVIGPDPSRLS
jgi:hypothetical protein